MARREPRSSATCSRCAGGGARRARRLDQRRRGADARLPRSSTCTRDARLSRDALLVPPHADDARPVVARLLRAPAKRAAAARSGYSSGTCSATRRGASTTKRRARSTPRRGRWASTACSRSRRSRPRCRARPRSTSATAESRARRDVSAAVKDIVARWVASLRATAATRRVAGALRRRDGAAIRRRHRRREKAESERTGRREDGKVCPFLPRLPVFLFNSLSPTV